MSKSTIPDLTGKKIGQWDVLENVGRNDARKLMYLCECTCGVKQIVLASNLHNGRSRMCRTCTTRTATKAANRSPFIKKYY